MKTVIVFEDDGWPSLLPLVYWRAVFDMRCGRRLLLQRLAQFFGEPVGLWVRPQLAGLCTARHAGAVNRPPTPGTILVNGCWLPDNAPGDLAAPVVGMVDGAVAFVACDAAVAARLTAEIMLDREQLRDHLEGVPRMPAGGSMIRYPWDLLQHNGDLLLDDWRSSTARIDGEIDPRAVILRPQQVHLGTGSRVMPGAVIDAEEGPIHIGDQVTIMPNAVIQGPTFIGDHSVINAGAWIRTNVTIGPRCKVGGEIGASILFGSSNKQHTGFVGHSIIAEWVNLGAGTTTSNLKNTYGSVRVPIGGHLVDSGQTFLGAIIGDFARTGINQSLSCGTTIGLGTSIATSRIPAKLIPSLRFITDHDDAPYDVPRCLQAALRAMARRQVAMSSEEQAYFLELAAVVRDCEGGDTPPTHSASGHSG